MFVFSFDEIDDDDDCGVVVIKSLTLAHTTHRFLFKFPYYQLTTVTLLNF